MRGYFSFNGQPVKLALLSACANLYRRGDLQPLSDVAAGTLRISTGRMTTQQEIARALPAIIRAVQAAPEA